ncbi:hypothetical protein ARMA_1338 [Ardenticatena maritima]|uniref:Uncharacterized protein n=1 Tax=Ardenticatena maritima TaxID=872965 RepID=A0A0M8K6Q7_9CHLR|nr:hypothetical protein ARMA_1338 [Ardenticatena maritima]
MVCLTCIIRPSPRQAKPKPHGVFAEDEETGQKFVGFRDEGQLFAFLCEKKALFFA